jgi:hypothetical protein
MNYYAIIKTDWSLGQEYFSRELLARWPTAKVRELVNPRRSDVLEFELPTVQPELLGSLNRRGNAVIFSGNLEDCAEFALWCRSIVPPSEPMIFCDEAMNASLPLEVMTTREDILLAFRGRHG